MEAQRLQKIIAEAGLGSRREAERMIAGGEVTINGRVAQVGDKAVMGKDHIKVNGKLLRIIPNRVGLVLFKPRGIMTTVKNPTFDHEALRGTVWEYLERAREKVFPIGKLDTDTEGTLLFTNDGELAGRLTKSKFEIPKVYSVKIDGHLEDKKIKRLLAGVEVEGSRVRVKEIEATKSSDGKQWLRVTITDPKNRIIRKIFEAVGHPVDKVRRDGFAGIGLRGLTRGDWRYLNDKEMKQLREYVGLETK